MGGNPAVLLLNRLVAYYCHLRVNSFDYRLRQIGFKNWPTIRAIPQETYKQTVLTTCTYASELITYHVL